MIRNEYVRFMQTLSGNAVSGGVRKIANLIHNHLDEIQLLDTYQGHRVKRIVHLAQNHWQKLSADIFAVPAQANEGITSIARLKSLRVGPFRGFARREDFDLDSPLVLIYGPNGTGKSSFCEALEYGLLGNVAEADSRRYRQQEFLRNARLGQFVAPVIEAVSARGETIPVVANEALYRFCFVDKNRIDNFSRIAAQLPARQTELISTLFGLDSFNDFVRKFTDEMNNYIDLAGAKKKQLDIKQQELQVHNQTIKSNKAQLASVAESEMALANQFKPHCAFAEMVKTLGTAETPGEIALLENELQQALPQITGLSGQKQGIAQKVIESTHAALELKLQQLEKSSAGLSFKQLYTAVNALNVVSKDYCPACKTPLKNVVSNPFTLAVQELEKLAHLSHLEQERDQLIIKLLDSIKSVYQMIEGATRQLKKEGQPNPLSKYLVDHDSKLTWEWWQSLHISAEGAVSAWRQLQDQVQTLEQRDVAFSKSSEVRAQKRTRLTQLKDFARRALELQTQRKVLEDGIQRATKAIANFNEVNKGLIEEVEKERPVVAVNQEIADSYARFVVLLKSHKDSLPGRLIANLGDTVVSLYNAFNRNDAQKDLLAGIRLPLAQGQSIGIAFQHEPGRYFDALHILSEGHIRCIGLAILMAKNLKEGCPLLIFDDPVNAIDDDHRESIRRTLFEDNFFDSKQIILTCHGEEFFKDIQNLLGAERAAEAQKLTFLPQLAEQHIQVDFNCAPRNYILAAQGHMERLEIREALTKSRQALESLAKGKVWPYVAAHGDGNLSIKMRSAKAPIELRNLVEQLRTKLSAANFAHPQRDAVVAPIVTLLDVNGDSREWRYLNKGTHEENDRAEFDRATVSRIVNVLGQLDLAFG